MSFAWASVAIVLLLLPGIFFFIGLASYERLSREVIRSGVVSEVAMAIAIATGIHFIAICILSAFGFRFSHFVLPVIQAQSLATESLVLQVEERAVAAILYLAITTISGFGLGWLVAQGIISGPLRRIVRHRWIYDIIDVDRKKGIVTAYVMTKIMDDSKIVMYRGRLHDIFLGPEGNISYIILKNCARYYMTFKDGELITSKQLELFGARQGNRPANVWDRLLIEGSNIANVLFDSSREIIVQPRDEVILDAALKRAVERLREIQRNRPS